MFLLARLRRAMRMPRCWDATAEPHDKYNKTFNKLQLEPTQPEVIL